MIRFSRRTFLRSIALTGMNLLVVSCAQNVPALTPTRAVTSGTADIAATGQPPTKEAAALPATPPATASPVPARTEAAAPTAAEATQAEPSLTISRPEPTPAPEESAYLAVIHGQDARAITVKAIAALGGMERFVQSGYDVVIKPNICNANHGPEYASTTNPDVVATLVELCLGAGAKNVTVMDSPFSGSGPSAYERSGIGEAVELVGGHMEIMKTPKYVEVDIPDGVDLKSWEFYRPILDADLVINVPIAKHHSLAKLTLGGKNLMGTIFDRSSIHRNLGQRIADITSLVRPQLTVIDAVRILMANGPTGGNLNDVKAANTIIASHDIVAADSYATSLFGLSPESISYIAASAAMGIGTTDLNAVSIDERDI